MDPEQNKKTPKLGQDNPDKKKEMVMNMIQADKKGDKRTAKFYQSLLKKHNFWDNQPTLRDDKDQIEYGNIEGPRTVEEVRKQPLDLPEDLEWCEIDIKDQKQLDEFYLLLTNHYVSDEDGVFRFDYSRQFLQWALTPPGYQPKWLVGIRDKNLNNQMVCSITGVPVHVGVEEDKIKMCQINFLCVHMNYRSKNLAAILIAEVTRRVNLRNKWQAIYTSGTVLPTPFCQTIYYHRSLNPKKLIDINFSGLGRNQTLPMVKKLYSVPEQPTIQLRPMAKKDIAGVSKLINNGLQKYKVKFMYTEQEIKHYFMPREGVVYSYVVDAPDAQKKKPVITDFISFYMLPSHVIGHKKYDMLYACYSFLNFATTVPYEKLIHNALIMAKKLNCDVYNCLNLMENPSMFEELHFQKGDGHLNYYFYNWIMKNKKIQPSELAVVLF